MAESVCRVVLIWDSISWLTVTTGQKRSQWIGGSDAYHLVKQGNCQISYLGYEVVTIIAKFMTNAYQGKYIKLNMPLLQVQLEWDSDNYWA